MLILSIFGFEVKLKIFIRVTLMIFIVTFSSCFSNLELRGGGGLPNHKDDEAKPVAVVVNIKLEEGLSLQYDTVFDKRSLKKIRTIIRKNIDNKIERSSVYFYFKDKSQLDEIKKKFDKVIAINMKISKTINFTGVLDIVSIVYFFTPAPEWGSYTFDTSVKITSSNNDKVQSFNYSVVSDFSYMFMPLWRNEPQVKAVEKGIRKSLAEMLKNKDLVTLMNKDGEISFEHYYNYRIEETGGRLIQKDHYSSFPFAIDVRSSWGISRINGYFTNDNGDVELGASGSGQLHEYHIQASTFKPVTKFVFSPTVGYYYQDIKIKDFGQDTRDANYGKTGYIPGQVEERDSDGNLISSSDNVYSLSYESQFSSTYLGGKLGLNLIYGDNVQFIFSPLFYFSLVEARHTTIIAGGNDFSDWTFPFLGMIGFNFETGLFFSKAHFGFKLGYDLTYFRKFDFAYNIKFNSTVYEDGILKSKKIEINKFDVLSNKFFIDIFILW